MPVERVEIVPATLDDVYPFFGKMPPYRTRAWAGRVGGKCIGLGGYYFLPDGVRVGFLTLSSEVQKYPVSLYRATRDFFRILRAEGVQTIRAVADPTIEAAERFLIHFDFQPIAVVQGHTVYQWHAPAP